jgi:hypothetical protein
MCTNIVSIELLRFHRYNLDSKHRCCFSVNFDDTCAPNVRVSQVFNKKTTAYWTAVLFRFYQTDVLIDRSTTIMMCHSLMTSLMERNDDIPLNGQLAQIRLTSVQKHGYPVQIYSSIWRSSPVAAAAAATAAASTDNDDDDDDRDHYNSCLLEFSSFILD